MEIKSEGSGAMGITEPSFKLNVVEIRHRIRPTYGKDKVEIVTDDDCEIVIENGKCFVVRKQSKYPSTYEECCKVLGVDSVINDNRGYRWELLCQFQELLINRDAYWKLAGDWKPDWSDNNTCYYAIKTCKNDISLIPTLYIEDCTLVFPTEEMRDIFYKNFSELIELVKELL